MNTLKLMTMLGTLSLTLAACSGGSGGTNNPAPSTTITLTTVDTIAGQVGVRGSQDGKGSQATFNYPVGLAATGAAGAKNGEVLLYIAALNESIRYTQVGYADNPVGTAIGKGSSGSVDGDANTALVRAPNGVAVGYDSPAYEAYAYWTEDDSCVVRKLTAYPLNGNRKAVTIAGKANSCGAADGAGAAARFNRPQGIVANTRTGEVFVADGSNYTIRRIYGGSVSTIAGLAGQPGKTDGMGSAARFAYPRGLAMDRQENLYVADSYAIRKIAPSGEVTTLAGNGTAGYQDGPGKDTQFNRLWGIAVDENGYVYVADSDNHCIRRVAPDGTTTTLTGVATTKGAADGKLNTATFDTPAGLAYYNKQLFVSDENSQTIRRIR